MDNPEMVEGAPVQYAMNASAFEESTNVFLPFYRQSSLKYAGETWRKNGNINEVISGIPYDDITAALDYYFKNYNNGRPFVLASHSQGSAIAQLVLKKYFKEHPEYYKRMVAAYVIGYAVTKDYLEANPHLPPASVIRALSSVGIPKASEILRKMSQPAYCFPTQSALTR